ncbi:MAG: hypothetical protein EXQ58_04715 [Acidobacteria bacterium]|nr:hypothetical protein [Acidobacteriota bacterium]
MKFHSSSSRSSTRKVPMLFRLTNWVMIAAFLFSVAVQYNDPDPVRWMLIYGLAGLACNLKVRRRLRWYFPAAVSATAFVWAASIAPRVIGKTTFGEMFQTFEMINSVVKEAREMGGLLIVAAWMGVLVVASRRHGTAPDLTHDAKSPEF